MPHQCVKCSRIIPIASREILEGCSVCHSKFFFYVRQEQLDSLNTQTVEVPEDQKVRIEKDVREIAGIKDENAPVVLDFESVRSIGEGKFELDLTKLFNKKRPLVYKLEEGKYMIDLATTMKGDNLDDQKI
ncbi:MAG: Zn-ribbon containing protein [Nanoarchaeota archaeon]|jgi:predicted  nucleic acid-binding Zn-ribbon protein|nr:Zn-ribbon containing protein [Nanoarchaeota archaeon]